MGPEIAKGGPEAAFLERGCLLSGLDSLDGDVHDAAATAGAELDLAGAQGEQGVVTTTTDAVAGVEVGAALANQNLAGVDLLTTETLDAEALRIGVATVT